MSIFGFSSLGEDRGSLRSSQSSRLRVADVQSSVQIHCQNSKSGQSSWLCQQFKFILCTLALFRWPQNHVNLFNVTKLFYIPWANKVVLFKHSTTNKDTFTKRYILFVYVEGNIGSLWIQNNVFTAVFTLNILNLGTSSSHHLTLVFMLIPVSFLSQTYKHTSDQILKTRFTLPGPCVPHKSTKRLFG